MEDNYIKMIDSMRHVVNNNGPLVIEHAGSVFAIACIKIALKHIEKAARKFENNDFEEIVQTTDSSFLLK